MAVFYENNTMPIRCFPVKDMTFSSHLHKEAELLFVTQGECSATADGREYRIREGDLLALFPNTVHSYHSPENFQGIIVIFSSELCGEFVWKLNHYHLECPVIAGEKVHEDIIFSMNRILSTPNDIQNLPLIKGYLMILLSHVIWAGTLISVSKDRDFDLIHRALLYVTENFKESLNLEDTAKNLGVSKYHLSRMFSEKVGCGFGRYINSLRIGLSQHMLENQTLSVAQIGFECGFDSLRTFNRVFREFLGCTPTQYRKEMLKADNVYEQ